MLLLSGFSFPATGKIQFYQGYTTFVNNVTCFRHRHIHLITIIDNVLVMSVIARKKLYSDNKEK